jgi:thiamine phosphate synthase YjbQ (UPF0047 family)
LAADGRLTELQRSGAGLVQQVNTAEASIPDSTTDNEAFPQAAADLSSFEGNNTNNLLQLARKLHEEHVREGLEKRDALVAEGHATAGRIVREAEAQHKADMSRLEQEKALAENDVQTLRNFEKDYRAKLKAYIESQLSDLEGAAGSTQKPPTGPTAITNTYQI